jgi:hypothetical protein
LPKKDTLEERKDIIKEESETEKEARDRAKKELEKEKEKAKDEVESQIEKLNRLILEDPALQGFNTGSAATGGGRSTPIIDAERKALPRGSRVSQKGWQNQYGASKGGRKYWENRENRSDRKSPEYETGKPYLAKGGNVYSSDEMYLIAMFKGDVDLDTISIRAKNKAEARMIFEDTYREKYEDKLGDFAIEIYLVKPFPEIDSYASGGVIKAKKVSDWDWGKIFEKVNLGLGQSFVTILPKNPDGGKIKYGLIIRDASNQFDRSSNLSYIFDLDDKYYPNDRQDVKDTISSPYYGKDEYKEIARGSHFLVITIQGNRKTLLKDLIDKVNYTRFSNINRRNETDIPFDYPNRFLYDLLVFEGSISDLVDFVQKLQSAFQYEGAKLYTEPTPYIMSIIWNIPQIIHYDGSVITPATYIPIFELANEVEAKTSKKRKYADGGEVEGVDLFEDYDDQPEEVQAILANYEMEDNDYETLQNLKAELESIGYTMDFGLDAEPYDLRKIGQTGKSEFYAKGGKLNTEVILTENRSNGAKWRGVVKPFMMKSIERNQYGGGFKRYEIDIYDDVEREPSKEELKQANEFFDKVGGRFAKGGMMADGGAVKPKIYQVDNGWNFYYFFGDNEEQVLKYFNLEYPYDKDETDINITQVKGAELKHLKDSEEYDYILDARDIERYESGRYTPKGENYEYVNTFNRYDTNIPVPQEDFEKLVDAYHKQLSGDKLDIAKYDVLKQQMGNYLGHETINEMESYISKRHNSNKYAKGGEMAHGGGVPYKPYGKTKGRFKLTYEVEGEPQSEIRQSLEEATDSAKRYSSPKLGYTNVHIHDESGKEYFFADGGYTESGEKLYEIANNMSDKEFQEAFRNLSEKEKDLYESLLRLGDESKIALATVLNESKKPKYDKLTWDLHRYEKGGEMAKGGITPQLNEKVYAKAQEILKAEGITENISQKQFNQAYDKAIKEFGYSPAYFKKVMREFGPEYPHDDDTEFGDFMADGGMIEPDKPIDKMTKLELMKFVEKIAPLKHFYPQDTISGRIQAKNLYNKYLERKKDKMADGGEMQFVGITDDEGNLIDIKVGDEVVEYRKRFPNAEEKTQIGSSGRVIKIVDNMAKVSFPNDNDYEEWIALKHLKKMAKGGMMSDGGMMADGGEVDFIERMAKMRSAYENLNMIVKSKIAMAVGIDRAISIMERDYSIDPFGLITSAVRGGLLELDEINKDLVNEAVYEAESVTDDYRDSGQGISGSDMTAFTKNVLDSAGYKTGFINNRLERVDEEGNKLEIDKYNMNY